MIGRTMFSTITISGDSSIEKTLWEIDEMKKERNVILVLKALSNQLIRYMGNVKK